MSRPAFSGEFKDTLLYGKYTQWAADLTEETLQAVLWAVGEWASRTAPLTMFVENEKTGKSRLADLLDTPLTERIDPLEGMRRGDFYMQRRGLAGLEILYRIYWDSEHRDRYTLDAIRTIIHSLMPRRED